MKTFIQRTQPLFAVLEGADVGDFFAQRDLVRALEGHLLAETYRELARAGVERASALNDQPRDDHVHKVLPSPGSGGSAGGSDEAFGLIEVALGGKPDNAEKLAASGAQERHLFVWLDDNTPFGMARPLSRDAPDWDDGSFGLPSRAPDVDPAITDLWIVHERSRRGWRWSRGVWTSLDYV
jgi:hypothetical protein